MSSLVLSLHIRDDVHTRDPTLHECNLIDHACRYVFPLVLCPRSLVWYRFQIVTSPGPAHVPTQVAGSGVHTLPLLLVPGDGRVRRSIYRFGTENPEVHVLSLTREDEHAYMNGHCALSFSFGFRPR